MLTPTRLMPKELKKLTKIEARRTAAKKRQLVNDFNARWLALKNDAVDQCAQGKSYVHCVYAVGMYVLIGLKALAQEGIAISEAEPVDTLKVMRLALQDTAEAEALTYDLRCALMDGIEIIEAATEQLSIDAICDAWQYVDQGLRNGTLSTTTMNQLIDNLQTQ